MKVTGLGGYRRNDTPKWYQSVLALLASAVDCCLPLERVAAVIGPAAGTPSSKQALHKRLTYANCRTRTCATGLELGDWRFFLGSAEPAGDGAPAPWAW